MWQCSIQWWLWYARTSIDGSYLIGTKRLEIILLINKLFLNKTLKVLLITHYFTYKLYYAPPYKNFIYYDHFTNAIRPAPESRVEELRNEAVAQANRYAETETVKRFIGTTQLHKIVVVYKGMEMRVCEEVDAPSPKSI